MKVLVACEYSGRVRDAFIARGHDAISCDLLPTEAPGPHIQGDLLDVIARERFDLGIFHPPCTYLCSSGLHWNKRRPERPALTEQALAFVRALMASNIPAWAIENPIGCISDRIRPPDQIIQPWQFGDDASKSTCLWLKNLNPLEPTQLCPPPNGRAPRTLGQPDRQRTKQAATQRRALEAAQQNLPRHRRCNGSAMAATRSTTFTL